MPTRTTAQAKIVLAVFLTTGVGCPLAAVAQRNNDPNLNHFYMGRQQVQIIDESPMITNKTVDQAEGSNRMNGAVPNRRLPLPTAGWQTYTPAQPPGLTSGLPKVINGVPPKAVPPDLNGNKGKAGALAAGKKSGLRGKPSQVAGSPNAASAYKPYATYKPDQQAASGATGATNNKQTSTNVRGSILHWARGAHRTDSNESPVVPRFAQ